MAETLRVLIVEDSEDDAELLVRTLRRDGYDPTAERVETAGALAAALATQPWDLVLADHNLPSFDAPAALTIVKQSGADVPFIVISGAIGEETAVSAMRAGAHDYLMKDNLARLGPAVRRELRDAAERRRRRQLEHEARQREKLAALGQLVAGIVHELNNPLGIIMSRLELMVLDASSDLPPAVREDLTVVHRQTQRLVRIAQRLLSFARQSSGERVPVSLNHVVAETLLLAESSLARGGVEIAITLTPALPVIAGDASALQQVVLNLLTNARDAIDAGGIIHVETRPSAERAGTVELTIADTGRGIAAEDLEHIFDPFFTTKPRGTGLGLSICHGIIQEHRGAVTVHSAPGQGTRFVLSFPALTPPG